MGKQQIWQAALAMALGIGISGPAAAKAAMAGGDAMGLAARTQKAAVARAAEVMRRTSADALRTGSGMDAREDDTQTSSTHRNPQRLMNGAGAGGAAETTMAAPGMDAREDDTQTSSTHRNPQRLMNTGDAAEMTMVAPGANAREDDTDTSSTHRNPQRLSRADGTISINPGDGGGGVPWAVQWTGPVSFGALATALKNDAQITIQGIDETLGGTMLAANQITSPSRVDLLIKVLELAPGADWDVSYDARLRDGLPDPIMVNINAFDPSVERRPLKTADLHSKNEIVRVYNPGGAAAVAAGPAGGLLSDEAKRERIEASATGKDGAMTKYVAEVQKAMKTGETRRYQVDVSAMMAAPGSTAGRSPSARDDGAGYVDTPAPGTVLPADSIQTGKAPEPPAVVEASLPDYSPYYVPPTGKQ